MPPTDWADEIDQMIFRGSKLHREAVFFHRASRTLILTDLIENFEAMKQPWHLRLPTRLAGIQNPDGQMPRDTPDVSQRPRRAAHFAGCCRRFFC